jgi:hypothetical protein
MPCPRDCNWNILQNRIPVPFEVKKHVTKSTTNIVQKPAFYCAKYQSSCELYTEVFGHFWLWNDLLTELFRLFLTKIEIQLIQAHWLFQTNLLIHYRII